MASLPIANPEEKKFITVCTHCLLRRTDPSQQGTSWTATEINSTQIRVQHINFYVKPENKILQKKKIEMVKCVKKIK